jgi:hypothetical protein
LNYNGNKVKALRFIINSKPDILLLTKSYQAAEFQTLLDNTIFFQTDTPKSINMILKKKELIGKKVMLIYDLGDSKYSELKLKQEHLSAFRIVNDFDSYILYEWSGP